MEEPQAKNQKLLAIVGLIIILAAVGVGIAATARKDEDQTSLTSPSTAATSSLASPAASAAAQSSAYKDGTYSATGSYTSPGGRETILVSLTVKDGKVSDTTATSGSTNPTGQEYQSRFISGYKAMVVGKSLDDVSLSRVSGSSLTPRGFNDAVSQIKAQAKA